MVSGAEREKFAMCVMEEVRRWPGVELRQHASSMEPGQSDGVEFRLYGKQVGHVHADCSVHIAFPKALKESLIGEQLAEPMELASTSGWAVFTPLTPDDAQRAIWLLRLNYIRLRRQRLTPLAAARSELLQRHEAALGVVSTKALQLLHRTQVRSTPRPLPSLDDAPSLGDSSSGARPIA